MSNCRYRYANDTRQQARYEGGNAFSKGWAGEKYRSRRVKPASAKPLTPGVWARWEFDESAITAVGSVNHFTGQGETPKGRKWWHETTLNVRQRRKAEKQTDNNAARVSPKKKAANRSRG